MPDTVRRELTRGQWTQLVTGDLTDCLVTASKPLFYVYTGATPIWDSGHSLGAFQNMNAAPQAGQSMWVLAPEDGTFVYVTEG